MRASFPTRFHGVLLGKSRESGEFDRDDGVKVSYGEAYDLSFEDSNGLAQTVRVSVEALDKAADFDVTKLPKLTLLDVTGDVFVRDDGATFKPSKVAKVAAS